MGLMEYSILEFKRMQESLIGSLVCFVFVNVMDSERKGGRGIVVDIKREHGEVFLKVFWWQSPFYRFKQERKVGWHLIDRLFILQNRFGEKNYAYQSKNFKREQK
jgi:hypothetical protein